MTRREKPPEKSPVAGKTRIAWLVANGTVFLSSFCVMVIELVAGRIVSRHLGASLYTWTSVIGVILAGLALGNYVGGRLADRFAPRRTLSVLFLLSSATCVAITVANNLVGGWTPLWSLAWPARVALHVTLVFFLPAGLLGTISPVVARTALGFGRGPGRTLGSISAWGVVGSIAGTFAAGYVLISLMGTAAIIWSVAGLLAVIGLGYAPRSVGSWAWLGAWLIGTWLAFSPAAHARSSGVRLALRETADPAVLYRDESRYSHVEVRRLAETGEVRGLYLDRLLHSQISMDDPLEMRYGYAKLFGALTRCWSPRPAVLRTLTIGGGGYVFPRYLEAHWPRSRIEVVEIDPAVTDAARAAFGLPDDSSIRTVHADGRVFVNGLAKRLARGETVPSYDFIYLDAVNDFAVPYQLTTVEFFEDLRALLAPGGALMINLIDVPASGRLLGALAGTVGDVFPHVAAFVDEDTGEIAGDSRLTFVLTARSTPAACRPESDPNGGWVMNRVPEESLRRYRAAAGDAVLTDDHAPVENLMAPVVLASSRDRAASEALAEGLRAAQRGDLDEFVDYCRTALALDPEQPAAHYNLGVGLHRLGDTERALVHWQRAVRFRPDYAEAHFNLGAVHFQRGQLDLALEHLGAAVRSEPRFVAGHLALGVALEASGDLAAAERRYERVLNLDPGRAEARRHLLRLREPRGNGGPRAAEPARFAPSGRRP